MDFLFPIAVIIGFVAAAVASQWVLEPLELAAEDRDCAIQFTLADVLCLFVLIQFVLGARHWGAHGATVRGLIMADVVLFLCVALGWWSVVRRLSRAGIRVAWQRCVVLLVVIPITAIGGFAAFLLPFAVADLFTDDPNTLRDACAVLAGPLLAGVVYAFGRFTRRIIAAAVKE